jgi:hypothetical protein
VRLAARAAAAMVEAEAGTVTGRHPAGAETMRVVVEMEAGAAVQMVVVEEVAVARAEATATATSVYAGCESAGCASVVCGRAACVHAGYENAPHFRWRISEREAGRARRDAAWNI